MAVVVNNAGNKMDAFLYTTVKLQGGDCVAGGRRSTMTVELFNNPPTKLPTDKYFGRGDREQLFGLERKIRRVQSRPTSGVLAQGCLPWVSLTQQLFAGEERSHPVAMFGVELRRGERKTVKVEFTGLVNPHSLNQNPKVLEQPMLNPQQISIQAGPQCARISDLTRLHRT